MAIPGAKVNIKITIHHSIVIVLWFRAEEMIKVVIDRSFQELLIHEK